MAHNQTTRVRSVGRHRATDNQTARSEEIHIRSYAHEWAYDVTVEVATLDGDVVFEADYYLQPGEVESELDALPPGEYEIRASLDNDTHETAQCHISPSPHRTAVIEVGNGVLSVTEGLPTQ